ncbi:asparagine synthase (glutamine-hydrolyzing) [uncultured Croceitalea sp.]|uniref:asparagine synthase (glutamine-hydrolyzing) n=1 Tax=uncultured Croceitalea sp. TaxID=1798908 RepID=UPI00374FD9CA
MCGINGFITNKEISKKDLSEQIESMNNTIFHRGPDDDGVFCSIERDYSIAMGMRRLAIIDLDSGKQPIYSKDKQIVIVFNGEIYNYQTLRNKLIKTGVEFETKSDTEVILKLYEIEGESSFSKLDGMFAFSIYDKKKSKVYIARDFFGEKPLYYHINENNLIWASELKSITPFLTSKPKISKTGLNLYLRLTYIPAPNTIFEGVHKLKANHYISYDIKSRILKKNIIHPDVVLSKKNSISFNDAKKSVKEQVEETVLSRSVSDVSIGTFLSGGVDSSIVSSCLAKNLNEKINTFSIGFKKASFDESNKSRIIAKLINSNHHEFIIDENDLRNDIHSILNNFDEPFSDPAALPTYMVSKKTSEHVKVALTGDGGDEVFGGYNKYYIGKLNKKYTSIIPKALHNSFNSAISPLLKTSDDQKGKKYRIKKLLNSISYNGDYYWDIISLGNTATQLKSLLIEKLQVKNIFNEYKEILGIKKPISLTNYRFIDKFLSLEGGMLPKVDRTSMLTSIECRAPLLNKDLWDFTNSLPEEYLLKGWNKKYILKEAFKSEFPRDFLEKSKQGFNVPVGDWLRSILKSELESYIEPKFLEKQQIFNSDYLNALVKNHLSGKEDNSDSVWNIYCFQKWYCNTYSKL